eukprot:gb/GEZN01010529.1/.p1 GENE.gb/GEZN01010529.1/~~gb/GEZN01010529.1/.p1  ORF type:complete len:382 (-),score=18.20 gb/GEZN01010529.1/:85-1161(-)
MTYGDQDKINLKRAVLNVFILANIVISSILINVVQFFITVSLFLSEKDRLYYCQLISTEWWKVWPWVMEVWEKTPVHYYGEPLRPDECGLLLSNHNRGMDCIPGTLIVDQFGVGMGRMMVMMKNALRFVPSVGVVHYFQGSLFLTRHWDEDKIIIGKKLRALETGKHPRPFMIGIFPEGTRFSKEKQAEGWKFADDRQLPKLNNVLLPRKKGFIYICSKLPRTLAAIYTVTCCYQTHTLEPLDFLLGKSRCRGIHMHIKRTEFSTLPENKEELYKWLVEEFNTIDKRIEFFKEHQSFREAKLSPRPAHDLRLRNLSLVFHALASTNAVFLRFVLSSTLCYLFLASQVFILYFQTSRSR